MCGPKLRSVRCGDGSGRASLLGPVGPFRSVLLQLLFARAINNMRKDHASDEGQAHTSLLSSLPSSEGVRVQTRASGGGCKRASLVLKM